MEKKLSYYLHLYLGCQVWCKNGYPFKLKPEDLDRGTFSEGLEKPILRPIADILTTEAYQVHKMYFDTETTLDWTGDTGSAYFQPKQRRVVSNDAVRIFNSEDWKQGDFQTVIAITNYLRSIFIDCDGLIESGLAIDAKTLLNNQP